MKINNFTEEQFRVFLQGLKSGEKKSWDLFYHRYNNIIINYCIRHASNMHYEDLVSMVYIKLVDNDLKRIKNFIGDSEVAFKSYLLKTTKYVIWAESRKIKLHSNIDEIDQKYLISDEPYLFNDMNNINWNDAILELSPIRRRIITLLLLGYKYREIADRMNISTGAISSHVSRSKPILRLKLKRYITE